jgi:hypothetical protein
MHTFLRAYLQGVTCHIKSPRAQPITFTAPKRLWERPQEGTMHASNRPKLLGRTVHARVSHDGFDVIKRLAEEAAVSMGSGCEGW